MRKQKATFFTLFAALILGFAPGLAQETDTSLSDDTDSLAQNHAKNFGIYYEFSHLDGDDLTSVMKMAGRRYDVEAKASDLRGLAAQYSINEWISIFSVLGYQRYDVDYADRDTAEGYRLVAEKVAYPLDSIDVQGSVSVTNLLFEFGIEAGFAFVRTRSLLVRAVASFGPLVGITNLDGTLFGNTPIYGYARGLSLQTTYKRLSLMAGLRTTHFYWHAYFNNNQASNENNSWMMDFDTRAAPFFVIGFGI